MRVLQGKKCTYSRIKVFYDRFKRMIVSSGILSYDKNICFGRRHEIMKQVLKAAAVTAVILIVFIVINVICNMNGINLDSISNGPVIAVCAMFIYQELTKKDKSK